jgi:hypothetical protein
MKSNIDKVYSKLPKTELATEKVELAMDFNAILKELQADIKKSNKQEVSLSKLAKSFIDAKSPDRSGLAANREKKVNAFFKDFSKKANELGIDVKTTQFFKEYQLAQDLVDQLKDTAMEVKSIIKSIK